MGSTVRVTVVSEASRVDLVVHGGVPVAELLPELARSAVLPDEPTNRLRIMTPTGRELDTEAGLTAQGVVHGAVLCLVAEADPQPPYDDPAGAMADVVCQRLSGWTAELSRRTTQAAGLGGLLLGAGLLAMFRPGGAGAAFGLGMGVALLAVAGYRDRRAGRDDPDDAGDHEAVFVALVGCAYATVAGDLAARAGWVSGTPSGCASAGALAAGVVAMLGLRRHRPLLLPPVLAGAVVLAGSALATYLSLDVPRVLTLVLGVAGWASSVLPTWAVTAVVGPSVDAAPVDISRLVADIRLAHQLVLGLGASASLLVVALAPVAVALDLGGVAVASLCVVVVTVRSRHHRSSDQVVTGLLGGVCGGLSMSIAVAAWQPALHDVLMVGAVVVGGFLLAIGTRRSRSSPWLARFCDLAETAALVSLAPAVALAVVPASWVGG